jgi:CRP-like cAMP-binding protein
MSLAARLKSRITALAQSARNASARSLSAAAIAVLLNDPLTAGPRTREQCNAVGAFLRGLSWFRSEGKEHLLDCCSYGVAEELAEGATATAIGAEAVFVMVLRSRAYVMQRANAKLPARVLFEGDCEHEGYLTQQTIRASQNSPIAIVAAETGTVVMRMSHAWLAARDYLNIYRAVGIDSRNPVYDKTTFLGRIPEQNLDRLLRRSRVRQFSAHHTMLDATPPPSDATPAVHGGNGTGHPQRHSSTHHGHASSTSNGDHPAEVGSDGSGSGASSGSGGGAGEVLYIAEGTVQVKWLFCEGDSVWYVPVATFGEREVVGLLEVLYGLPVSYQVIATTPVKVLCIPRAALAQIPAADLK